MGVVSAHLGGQWGDRIRVSSCLDAGTEVGGELRASRWGQGRVDPRLTSGAGVGLGSSGRGLWVPGVGPHHVLVIEQVHHAGCPLAHGHQVRRGLVEPQQAQGCTLLHAVHAVPVGTRCRGEWGSGCPRPHTPPLLLFLPGRVARERERATWNWGPTRRGPHGPAGLGFSICKMGCISRRLRSRAG